MAQHIGKLMHVELNDESAAQGNLSRVDPTTHTVFLIDGALRVGHSFMFYASIIANMLSI
jgi:hypothetical protein